VLLDERHEPPEELVDVAGLVEHGDDDGDWIRHRFLRVDTDDSAGLASAA
jgi:hypothetical protein